MVSLLLALPFFIIGLPKTFYDANRAKVQTVLLDLHGYSDTPENRAKVDAGFWEFVKTANTNTVVLVYHVTREQVKDRATPARIAAWRTILENHPQVKLEKGESSADFWQLIDDYNLEPRHKP